MSPFAIGARCSSLVVNDLLLHGHLLGKHGLVLLVHLLVHSHLLINELLLLEHHLLLLLGPSAVSGFVSYCWLRLTETHWHHVWVLSCKRISRKLSGLLARDLSSCRGGCGFSFFILLCLSLSQSCFLSCFFLLVSFPCLLLSLL